MTNGTDQFYILPLGSPEATPERAGGKGANLSILFREGLPVPDGFIVTTAAYERFVEANDLGAWIRSTVEGAPGAQEASHLIRTRFAAASTPPEVAGALQEAYTSLGSPPVAVRSSATAEDLPDLSFAGQQDTFLNVIGGEALATAAVRCWSSLWTARAIAYRRRNAVSSDGLSIALVVQTMVPSEASGVLFTANPLTGRRTEVVIEATFGLGEALVSGQVEPDHFVVSMPGERITGRRLGAKNIAQDGAARQALPDAAIIDLARLGAGIAAVFGAPQDIEWALAQDRIRILQSRPITSLYPLPEGIPREPLQVLFSFAAVQGVLDPLTPLGRDLIRSRVFGGMKKALGVRNGRGPLVVAGERLFVNVTGLVEHPWLRRRFVTALGMVDLQAARKIESLPQRSPRGAAWRRLLWRAPVVLARPLTWVLYNLLRPRQGRERFHRRVEATLAAFREQARRSETLSETLALLDTFCYARLPRVVLGCLMPAVGAGVGSLRVLNALAEPIPQGHRLALEATRGLPHNVTTRMDLALWEVARVIRADPASAAHFESSDAAPLAEEYLAGGLPRAARNAIAGFLEQYGMRGVAEVDLGRPRWREDPTQLMQVLRSYLRIDADAQAPDAVFAKGAARAEAAIAQLIASARSSRHGWLRAQAIRWFSRRMRELAGLRESPKFFMVRVFGILRERILEAGRELVTGGVIDRPGDLFLLHIDELQALAAGDPRDWRTLITARRLAWERERRRRQVPRLLFSDGEAFYGGALEPAEAPAEENGGVLIGVPVSPGVAEGSVRVVLDPKGVQVLPGEILVCPATDPGWTPLFLTAAGLVMELGGMMTHGSVVAREYGIPAVVGVHQVTTRLHTGQRVRVDGSTGEVFLLGGDG